MSNHARLKAFSHWKKTWWNANQLTGSDSPQDHDARDNDLLLAGDIDALFAERDQLRAQLEEAKRVIEWYGDIENWDVEAGTCHDMKPKGLYRKLYKVLDMGQKAREFLERRGE